MAYQKGVVKARLVVEMDSGCSPTLSCRHFRFDLVADLVDRMGYHFERADWCQIGGPIIGSRAARSLWFVHLERET